MYLSRECLGHEQLVSIRKQRARLCLLLSLWDSHIDLELLLVVGDESVGINIHDSACFNQTGYVVLLGFQGLVLVSEPGCGDSTKVVENDVSRVLFSADTVGLAALRQDLYADEGLHLILEWQYRSLY